MNAYKIQRTSRTVSSVGGLIVIVLSALSSAVARADECRKDEDGCVAVGKWALSIAVGLGGRTNPIINSDDIPIILMPSISYYGERFFWETDTLGFTFFSSKRHMVNAIATISYDQTFFNEWGVGNLSIEGGGNSGGGRVSSSFQNAAAGDELGTLDGGPLVSSPVDPGRPEPVPATPNSDSLQIGPMVSEEGAIDLDRLHDRDIAGLVGFEYSYELGAYNLGVQALDDASGVHEGSQIRAALSRFADIGRGAVELTLGAEWRDSKTLDYYYGVRPDEVDAPLHSHKVDDDVSYYARLDWRYQLSASWQLRSILHHRVFGSEIKNSPLVSEDSTTAVFFGGVYHF